MSDPTTKTCILYVGFCGTGGYVNFKDGTTNLGLVFDAHEWSDMEAPWNWIRGTEWYEQAISISFLVVGSEAYKQRTKYRR